MRSIHSNEAVLDDSIFLGRAAEALSTLIAKQVEAVFNRVGIVVPVKSCSLLSTLAAREPASAADLAKSLDQSHQLVLQKVPALINLKLIRRKPDATDRRRKVYCLTARGRRQLDRLRRFSPAITSVYAELNAEIAVDLCVTLEEASRRLRNRPLIDRFPEAALEAMEQDIEP